MRGTYIGRDRMLIDLAYGGVLIVPSDDYGLMPVLATRGAFEPPLTNYLMATVQAGQTVVDVGANVGYFTVLAAARVGTAGRVIAFEANPAMCGLLKDNLTMNWLADHVEVRNEAVYSENGSVKFHASSRFPVLSSIRERPPSDNRLDEITMIEVPAVRLDDALASVPTVDLVKLDIEGGEYDAFLGMMNLIRERRVGRIIFEWNAEMLGDQAKRFANTLRTIRDAYGGVFHILNEESKPAPVSVDALERVPFYPFALIEF